QERQRSIVENGLGFLCTHDQEGRLQTVNPPAAAALGYAAEELIGRNLAEIVAPAFRAEFSAYLERVRHGERTEGLMRVVTSAGEERIWLYRNVLHAPASGPP